ncbi:hypothetical protein P175DRAFT_0500380 [Aspergillus ochraceoroseus IBT 24754]|uniref:Uncharacterized protein n=2 Tax=Aspergillus ochraceoroseus TaxID=138278 RepID=A0A2T5LYX6_9EURO|nr:uncharacterized protein P175DRAFT_0500380 [Aspergillus ochraceoroseus IBT 24754]KKK17957.1 hypothetical protein AOCH_007159 [Aspergillus ochraceoroseus]PTU21489.1 hypothetical protein P175DRAFT_0500380 [Aspergillus ochraceoroseus IBT 24754]
MAPSQKSSSALQATRTQTSSAATAGTITINPDFTNPSFDPVDFLNDVLPPLTLASSQTQSYSHTSRGGNGKTPVNLADLSSRVQSVLSQANALNIRQSNTLTQLTDEILRSGSRLAYEVEILRGETIGLSDTLTDGLREEMARFSNAKSTTTTTTTTTTSTAPTTMIEKESNNGDDDNDDNTEEPPIEAEYITKLRTLNAVRAHLDDVVQTFGDAMEWPLPPSETSLASSFISVSAPDSGPDSHSREEKGQEVAKKLRTEIATLLGSDDAVAGLEAATDRIEALRVLATVWKGTAEEKARNRIVDGLAKMVDDKRRRVLDAQGGSSSSAYLQAQPAHGVSGRGHQRQESEGPGGGIFKNLQRLREEIYLE